MRENTVFSDRIEAVRDRMKEHNTSVLMLVPSSYMKYVTGYSIRGDERFFAFIMPADGPCLAVGNVLYKQQMADIPAEEFLYWKDGENAMAMVKQELGRRGIAAGEIIIDPGMPAVFIMELIKYFPESRLVNAAPLIDPLRIYKDEAERQTMREACRRADTALKNTIGNGVCWLGHSEEEFLAKLVYEMARLGIQNGAACVCAGVNAAVPHHRPGKSLILEGKCLLVDFGGDYENYNTDMTRNFYFGTPTAEYRKVYHIVLEAQEKGKQAAASGGCLQDIDRAVRGHIAAHGYGEYFTHRTGHGIGIDCHEGPSVAEGELTGLAAGMTFSIEPGIYLSGKFGVRIEDQIMMTEDGPMALHHYPLELQVIPCR